MDVNKLSAPSNSNVTTSSAGECLTASKLAVIFPGALDPLVDQKSLEAACRDKQIQLYTYPDANHSLETGDVQKDLENLKAIMKVCEEFVEGI